MTLAAPKRNLRIAVWIVSSMASVVAGVQVDQPWRLEAPRREVKEHVRGFLWIEAENFASYGGWLLDTQFAHKMGSGYLLAAGVEDEEVCLDIAQALGQVFLEALLAGLEFYPASLVGSGVHLGSQQLCHCYGKVIVGFHPVQEGVSCQ